MRLLFILYEKPWCEIPECYDRSYDQLFIAAVSIINMIKWVCLDKIIFVLSSLLGNINLLFIFHFRLKIQASRIRFVSLIEQSKRVSSFYVFMIVRLSSCKRVRNNISILFGFSVSKILTPQSIDESTTDKFEDTENARKNTGIHWLALPPKSDGCSLYLSFDGTLFFLAHYPTCSSRICIEIG